MSVIDELAKAMEATQKKVEEMRLKSARIDERLNLIKELFEDDAQAEILTELFKVANTESEHRVNGDLALAQLLLDVSKVIEQKIDRNYVLIKAILGIEEDTTDGEILERAKDLGEIYKEIRRRAGGISP